MKNSIPVNIEDTNAEVFARIVKSTATKYDCSMEINFQDGKRETRFIGDRDLKSHIIDDVKSIFQNG